MAVLEQSCDKCLLVNLPKVCLLTMFVAFVSDTKPSLSSIMASSAWARLPSICIRGWKIESKYQKSKTPLQLRYIRRANYELQIKKKVNLCQNIVDKIVVMYLGVYTLKQVRRITMVKFNCQLKEQKVERHISGYLNRCWIRGIWNIENSETVRHWQQLKL